MSARLFAPKANPEKLTVTGWALYAGDATTLPPLRTVSSGTERRMVTVHATIEQLIVHFVLIPAIRIIVRITRASLSTVSLFALSPFYYSLALIFSHSRSVWRALFMLGKLLRSFCMLKRLSLDSRSRGIAAHHQSRLVLCGEQLRIKTCHSTKKTQHACQQDSEWRWGLNDGFSAASLRTVTVFSLFISLARRNALVGARNALRPGPGVNRS